MKIDSTRVGIAPLLKWPGGKRSIAGQILPFISGGTGRYYEPFVGGAAMFFALRPITAVLSDINSDLIACYEAVRRNPVRVAALLALMPNTERDYYLVRDSRPVSHLQKAARFIYLTSLSFNGIYRQNLLGEFNVPYGYKLNKKLPDRDVLTRISEALKLAKLLSSDFEEATECAKAGDIIYFDPPYTVAHDNNGFIKYNAAIFSWEDQQRLASHAVRLADRGCHVVVSNANHSSVKELYERFVCHTVTRGSVIASKSTHRRQVTECIFVSQ